MSLPPKVMKNATASIDDYIKAGFHLVAIEPGTKGPRTSGWNTRANAITDPKQFPPGLGVGIAHAWSNTCSIDVDDLKRAQVWFKARNVDIDAMLANPSNVQIVSGKFNKAKLLFAMPRGSKPLPSKVIVENGNVILEFRCATATGKTVQCCIPPTIHPGTKQPYTWIGDWQKLPELPIGLHDIWCELIDGDKERHIPTGDGSADANWAEVESALYEIGADCNREIHTDCGMAMKYAAELTGEVDYAKHLFLEWSRTGGEKYKNDSDVLTQWKSYDHTKSEKPITLGTLFFHARNHGWKRKMVDVSGMFEDMTLPAEVSRAGFPASTRAELVSPVTMSEELGLNGYVGLRIPYFDTEGEPVMDGGKPYSRVLVIGTKWRRPWRKRIGAGVHAYLPTQVNWADAKQSSAPIFIVESEKAASLFAEQGLVVIGLESIAAFRDGGKVVPEINGFDWQSRNVFILPSGNSTGAIDGNLIRASAGLIAWLKSRKANAVLVDFCKYDDPSDLSKKKMVSITTNPVGHVDLNSVMGAGWEKFASALGEIAYVKAGGQWVHLTGYCGAGKNPVRTKATMTADLANRNVEVNGKLKPVFRMVEQSKYRIEVGDIVFAPHEAPMQITNDGASFNTWGGFRLLPKRNDAIAAKIRATVRSFFSTPSPYGVFQTDEQIMAEAYFWGWKAHLSRCSAEVPTVSITLQSRQQGVGKSILIEMDHAYMGDVCKIITPAELFSDFSDWMVNAYYVIVNEPGTSDGKHSQYMKVLRSNPKININIKHGAKYEVANVMRFAMTTNESFTHNMDEAERRDFVYSPEWVSITEANKMPAGVIKDQHLEHNRLMVELATHLSPRTDSSERDEWGAALYAMLLETDPDEMGFRPNAPAPATVSKTRMARASMSQSAMEKDLLVADMTERVKLHGGVAFTAGSFERYLIDLEIGMRPLEAKRLIGREVVLPSSLVVTRNMAFRAGKLFNEAYWKGYGVGFLEPDVVKVWSIGIRHFRELADNDRKKWILATSDDAREDGNA